MHDLETARLKIELANTKFDLKELRMKHAHEAQRNELVKVRGELDKAKADIAEHSVCSNTVFEQQDTIKAQRNELVKVRGELAYTKDTLNWLRKEHANMSGELVETKNTLEWLRKEHANMSDEVRRLRNNPPRYPTWPAQDFGPNIPLYKGGYVVSGTKRKDAWYQVDDLQSPRL